MSTKIQIVRAEDGEVLYEQIMNPDVMPKLVGELMSENSGSQTVVNVIREGGHKFSFTLDGVDIDKYVRLANGIAVRKKKEVVEATAEASEENGSNESIPPYSN